MSPEVLEEKEFKGDKIDIYSYGIVLWQLWTRMEPFTAFTDYDVFVKAVTTGVRPTITDDFPVQIAQLIKDCWDTDPEKRPVS